MNDQKVAGYYRVSVARDDMKAPELYQDEIERYCNCRSLELFEVFSDVDHSGYRGAKPRPALEELKRRRLEFSSVIIPKLSRFGRSVKDLVNLFDLFDKDGIALVFLDMNIDSSTSHGRLLRHIMAAFAEYESDVKSDYARANHRMVRAQGRPWGGRPPFGYERHPTDRSYVVNRTRAEIVRGVFVRYRAGRSQYEIARELNEERLVRPSGAPWSCQQIGRVLDNPAYAGLCIVDDELIDAVWEPIIDRDVWEQVRGSRAADKRRCRQLRVAKGGPYLLSGLIYCGLCGHKLHHRSRPKSANGIYVCVRPGGKWCPGGSLDCALADDYVTQRFLEHCHFSMDDGSSPTFSENSRRWEAASLLDRRKLLSLAIKGVVLTPWPGGYSPRRVAGKPRQLSLQWAVDTGDLPLVLVTSPAPSAAERPKVSEGRSEMMRALEAGRVAKRHKRSSERSRAYFEEWSRFRQAGRGRG